MSIKYFLTTLFIVLSYNQISSLLALDPPTVTLHELEEVFCKNYKECPTGWDIAPQIFFAQLIILFENFIHKTNEELIPHGIPPQYEGYVEKINLKPDTEIITIGDLHGSLFSLLRILRRLEINGYIDESLHLTKPCKIIFLGDYVDRSPYGIEVLFIILLLKIRNWSHVKLLRGNHEAIGMNNAMQTLGVTHEIKLKYPHTHDLIIEYLKTIYKTFPLAVFARCNNDTVQFCHGGTDPNFNPQIFITDRSSRFFNITDQDVHSKDIGHSGFLWTDFICQTEERNQIIANALIDSEIKRSLLEENLRTHLFTGSSRGTGIFTIDTYALTKILPNHGIKAYIRAHQDFGVVLKLLNPKNSLVTSWENNYPVDWKMIIPSQQHTNQLIMANYEPVFTIATPSCRSDSTTEGFVIIKTGNTYEQWAMSIYEYHLGEYALRYNKSVRWAPITLREATKDSLLVEWTDQLFVVDDNSDSSDEGLGAPEGNSVYATLLAKLLK